MSAFTFHSRAGPCLDCLPWCLLHIGASSGWFSHCDFSFHCMLILGFLVSLSSFSAGDGTQGLGHRKCTTMEHIQTLGFLRWRLDLETLLPQLPECCDCKCALHLAEHFK